MTGSGVVTAPAAAPVAAGPRLAGEPARTSRSKSIGRRLLVTVPPVVLLAGAVLVWQFYCVHYHTKPQVLPSPARVARMTWRYHNQLWANTLPTVKETAVGFSVSLVVAVMFAVLIDFFGVARRALYPVLIASQTLPIIAIAPLIVIWFGFGLMPKVIVVALVTFFPITVSLIEGFNSTEKEATNLLRSMGAGRVRIFWIVRMPSSFPYFFTGLRIAITYAVVGAIFAEYVGATTGLGIYMQLQKNSFRTDLVLAAVLITALLSVCLFAATFVVQRLTIPWYYRARRQSEQ
jgi:ABC-type nitrate/sulfonate/bicarbonate transport system permease component